MTIHLPADLETSIRAEVDRGRFASVDDAVAEAVRSFLRPTPTEVAEPTVIGGTHEAEGRKSISEEILEIFAEIPEEAWDAMPTHGHAGATAEHKPIWEKILERNASIPDEEWDKLPVDSSAQLDHYIYGTPKRPTS